MPAWVTLVGRSLSFSMAAGHWQASLPRDLAVPSLANQESIIVSHILWIGFSHKSEHSNVLATEAATEQHRRIARIIFFTKPNYKITKHRNHIEMIVTKYLIAATNE